MPAPKATARHEGRRSETRLGAMENAAQADGTAVAPLPGPTAWAKAPAWVLLAGSVWVLLSLFTNARFRVTEVAIEGARLVRREDVLRVASVVGRSVFDIRARQIESRLEGAGLIEEATVRCRLPNQVSISLLEREAALIWESGGRHWWIDAQGAVLGATDGPGTMPVLHDIAGFAPEPGGHIPGVPWGLAHELWAALPAIQAFDYAREHGLVLYVTASEWPVYLGHQGDARLKVALLWRLVEELNTMGVDVEYIDLRNEERPTYKSR